MEISPADLLEFAQLVAKICGGVVALALLIMSAIWFDEKIKWNRGVSRRTGKRWKFIKRDKASGFWVYHDGDNYQAFMFRTH
ncbi:hypothetical protein [Streptomyces sp. CHB9.2]|uniref:hypothetical protein n=1 Tax=Streptomyces sp. CHB9.2 TaxID=2841670 RepID=UPI002095D366|nr:hypothetical protein [Streptomyces sp. CHB9.2]MCO6704847.1 hypothetical protein [Streptomyces sp. CHB9.2]